MNIANTPGDEHNEPGRSFPARNSDQANAAGADHPRRGTYWQACFLSWLGILLAGGMYGVLIGGNEPIFSFFAGIIVAGIFSAPTTATIAVVAWCFWLSRFQVTLATLVGASTGMLSSAPVAGFFHDNAIPMILLAGLMGGCGGGIVAVVYWNVTGWPPASERNGDAPGWQFSLRDMFWRFTVVAVLIAVWTLFLRHFLPDTN